MRIITVGRFGSRTANGYPIYTTKLYAARRRSDGTLTWRLHQCFPSDATSGRHISRRMIERAVSRAETLGVDYLPGIIHGQTVVIQTTQVVQR